MHSAARTGLHHSLPLGIALGAGSAKGFAHIGVLTELEAVGVRPDLICGTSSGALIAAIYAAGKLDEFEAWTRQLDVPAILRLLDLNFTVSGGMATAQRLIEHFRAEMGDLAIEDLATPFAAIATDLYTGREVWLTRGSLWDAVRASVAVPGLLTPQLVDGRWLVDGGLVNPVPVSLCRALGAEKVIAVNLLADVIGKHIGHGGRERPIEPVEPRDNSLLDAVTTELRSRAGAMVPSWLRGGDTDAPGMMTVVASSLDIMQDRITRSRLAGEPPELLLTPRLAHVSLLEFHRAAEAIDIGRRCVQLSRQSICELLGLPYPQETGPGDGGPGHDGPGNGTPGSGAVRGDASGPPATGTGSPPD